MTWDFNGGDLIQMTFTIVAILGGLWGKLTRIEKTQAVQKVQITQIKERLDGNGDSVPSRCKGHSQKLKDLERRVGVVE